MTPPSPSSLLASFQEHYDDLLSFLTRRLRDRHRAADVAQETGSSWRKSFEDGHCT